MAYNVEYCLNTKSWENDWQNQLFLQRFIESGADWARIDTKRSASHATYDLMKLLHDNDIQILAVFGDQLFKGMTLTKDNFGPTCDQALAACADYIDAAECWNEPDLAKFSNGYMDGTPEHYFELLQQFHGLMNSADVPVIGGSLASLCKGGGCPGDDCGTSFIETLKMLGAEGYMDAWSYHNYLYFVERAYRQKLISAATTEQYHKYMRSLVGDGLDIWMTEVGHGGSDQEQLAYMTNVFDYFLQTDCEFVSWFEFTTQSSYSLIRSDFSKKPAFDKFVEYANATAPPPPPAPEPEPEPTIAARVISSPLILGCLRTMRNSVFTKEQHKKLHPLI